jgi:ABC-type multidrug transport system permease subunit
MNEPLASTSAGRHPFIHLILARVREFWREPVAIFWVYVFPLVMVVALGVAFRDKPVGGFTVAVMNQGPSAQAIAKTLQQADRFRITECDEVEAMRRLHTGRAELVVVAASDGSSRIDYHYDPTQANSVLARQLVDELLQRDSGRTDRLQVTDHTATEPGGRYIDFLVPGLLGMGLLGGGMWGVGFAIVDMRLRKLLKRYLATPMRRSHFLAALMTSRVLFTVPEVIILLLFSRLFFGVACQGSYLTLGLLIVCGTFEFAGIGLLIASRAQTIETVSGLMNAVMIPMWIGSGIFFSTERFPDAMQPFLQALPLTPLIQAMRGVMLEGSSLLAVAPQLALIVAWGVITFVLALRWFRWS